MRFSRIPLYCLLAFCLAASPVLAQDSDENSDSEGTEDHLVVLNGGGFGHGVGLSQFGAYGRALDDHTYDDILLFYYHDTTLEPITNFKEFDPSYIPESIDVLVGVRERIAISTPLDELGEGEWELSVEAGGAVIGVSHLPLTTYYDGTRWHAEFTDDADDPTDLCDNDSRCENTALEVVQTVGTRAVVEEFEDGPNLGSYAGGRYLLHPSSVATDGSAPDDCGTGLQFCVTHSHIRPFEASSLNVLIGVRERIAISTPLDELGEGEWELSVEAGGAVIGVSHLPLTTYYDGTRWHAEFTDDADDPTDLCDNDSRCENTALEVVQTVGTRAVVEEFEDGPNLGSYAGGRYLLHPAAVTHGDSKPDRCGSGLDFCVVVAQLDFEKYLYGLQEVPVSWPLEALKAQAVAARSYAAATVVDRAASSDWADEPFNLFDSTADQVFTGWARESGCVWHSWCDAVDGTEGEVVVYPAEIESDDAKESENEKDIEDDSETEETEDETVVYEPRIAQAFYSSSNGGHTAKPSDVWTGGNDLPFLVPKLDPFDSVEQNPNASWTRSYSVADLTRWLNNYTVRGEEPLNMGMLTKIEIEAAPMSGYLIFATITVHDANKSVTLTRDGEPYGAWLFFAILNGCKTAQGCRPPIGSKFVIDEPVINFSDISPDDYFCEPVLWAASKKLTKGATPEMFGPHAEINRAEFAEILWRLKGSPLPSTRSKFEDVALDAPYRYAVDLLAEDKVTTGTSPTTFSPDMTLTRAQASTFLWRFAGPPASTVDTTFEDDDDGSNSVTTVVDGDATVDTTFEDVDDGSNSVTTVVDGDATVDTTFEDVDDGSNSVTTVVDGDATVDTTFEDVDDGSYYSEAVRWMVEHGITTGTSPTMFSPDDSLTRAEVVTFIWRLASLPEAEAFAPWVQPVLPPKYEYCQIPSGAPVHRSRQ